MHRLPEYPARDDMWKKLSRESRPIVIYGMGNGADKLIKRLDSLGIKYADIFASDGFVRGHSFHGVRVKSFSEIKELYSDFVIALSFATRLDDVIEMLLSMNEEHTLFVPDMPVSEEEIYFDAEFYNAHYEEIKAAFSALADEESKNVFSSIIQYKLSGRIENLLKNSVAKDEMYSLLPCAEIRAICDIGAYSGDTLKEALLYFPNLEKALCIEPDKKTFKRLQKFADSIADKEIECINAAAWSSCGEGEFSLSGNRNSSVLGASTESYQHKSDAVSLLTLDSLCPSDVDYIKYDVEGSEREALIGSSETIKKHKPALLVSLYHKSRDIFELINLLSAQYPYYRFYLRRLRCLPAWEINLIMLP